MKESLVNRDIMFIPNYQAPETADPSECKFDLVSPAVSDSHEVILRLL
jgi:hypothetical protein